jgi:nitrite reductase/ring-hydroxylating ferredoxin subunit
MEDGLHHHMSHSQTLSEACASCISRRDFVAKSAGLAAVAAFFAACGGDGGITDPVVARKVKVSDFAGLATVGQLVLVDGQRAVKRTGTGTFAAYSRACTHEGTAVSVIGSGTGSIFTCPNHGARFDNDGHVTLGPAGRNLTVLAASYDAATDTLTIG